MRMRKGPALCSASGKDGHQNSVTIIRTTLPFKCSSCTHDCIREGQSGGWRARETRYQGDFGRLGRR